jgi:hypothetical protein
VRLAPSPDGWFSRKTLGHEWLRCAATQVTSPFRVFPKFGIVAETSQIGLGAQAHGAWASGSLHEDEGEGDTGGAAEIHGVEGAGGIPGPFPNFR